MINFKIDEFVNLLNLLKQEKWFFSFNTLLL